jgi:hypothetical protein
VKVLILPAPLAGEYTFLFLLIDPVVRSSWGFLALPDVGIDVLLISAVLLISHFSPWIITTANFLELYMAMPCYFLISFVCRSEKEHTLTKIASIRVLFSSYRY